MADEKPSKSVPIETSPAREMGKGPPYDDEEDWKRRLDEEDQRRRIADQLPAERMRIDNGDPPDPPDDDDDEGKGEPFVPPDPRRRSRKRRRVRDVVDDARRLAAEGAAVTDTMFKSLEDLKRDLRRSERGEINAENQLKDCKVEKNKAQSARDLCEGKLGDCERKLGECERLLQEIRSGEVFRLNAEVNQLKTNIVQCRQAAERDSAECKERIEELGRERDGQRAGWEICQRELADVTRQAQQLELDLIQSRDTVTQLTSERDAIFQQCNEAIGRHGIESGAANAEISRLSGILEVAQDDFNKCKQQLRVVTQRRDELELQVKAYQVNVARCEEKLKAELEKGGEEAARVKAACDDQVRQLTADVDRLKAQLISLRATYDNCRRELTDEQKRGRQLQESNRTVVDRLQRENRLDQVELDEAKNQLTIAQERLEAAGNVSAQVANLQNQVRVLQGDKDQLEAQLQDAQTRLAGAGQEARGVADVVGLLQETNRLQEQIAEGVDLKRIAEDPKRIDLYYTLWLRQTLLRAAGKAITGRLGGRFSAEDIQNNPAVARSEGIQAMRGEVEKQIDVQRRYSEKLKIFINELQNDGYRDDQIGPFLTSLTLTQDRLKQIPVIADSAAAIWNDSKTDLNELIKYLLDYAVHDSEQPGRSF